MLSKAHRAQWLQHRRPKTYTERNVIDGVPQRARHRTGLSGAGSRLTSELLASVAVLRVAPTGRCDAGSYQRAALRLKFSLPLTSAAYWASNCRLHCNSKWQRRDVIGICALRSAELSAYWLELQGPRANIADTFSLASRTPKTEQCTFAWPRERTSRCSQPTTVHFIHWGRH